MNELIMHGALASKYGQAFRMDVSNPGEAIRAACCQLPGLREMIRSGEFFVVREMPNGSFAIDEDMLSLGMHGCKLHLLPSIEGGDGSKRKGGVKLVLGVALIAGSFYVPGGAFFGAAYSSLLFGAGAALALAGASLLIAPQTKLETGTQDSKNSALFGGSPSSTGQNLAVPLAYGRCRLAGIPIASQIVTNEFTSGGGFENRSSLYGGIGGASFSEVLSYAIADV